MHFFMFAQIPFVPEPSIADITGKWHLARVKSHMDFDGVRISERFLTNFAGKRFFTRMNPPVTLQIAFIAELQLANVALELQYWPIRMNNFLMILQPALLCVPFVALVAGKRLDAGMREHVRCQLSCLQKLLVTNVALVRQFTVVLFPDMQRALSSRSESFAANRARMRLRARMRCQMNLQLMIECECLSTECAFEWLLRGMGRSFMFSQHNFCEKLFLALRTVEGTLGGMFCHVLLQIIRLTAFIFAFRAGERSLARVDHHVRFQG